METVPPRYLQATIFNITNGHRLWGHRQTLFPVREIEPKAIALVISVQITQSDWDLNPGACTCGCPKPMNTTSSHRYRASLLLPNNFLECSVRYVSATVVKCKEYVRVKDMQEDTDI